MILSKESSIVLSGVRGRIRPRRQRRVKLLSLAFGRAELGECGLYAFISGFLDFARPLFCLFFCAKSLTYACIRIPGKSFTSPRVQIPDKRSADSGQKFHKTV